MVNKENLFSGDIYFTADYEEVLDFSNDPNYIIFALEDENNADFIGTNVLVVSYLLPPYLAWECNMMGSYEDFSMIYYSHLNTEKAQSYFAIIFAAMIKGKTVLIYIPSDDQDLQFVDIFARYVNEVFGVTIGSVDEECSFNTSYFEIIKDLVLKYGYIEPECFEEEKPIIILDKVDNCPFKFIYEK